jgi:hypothetical protein
MSINLRVEEEEDEKVNNPNKKTETIHILKESIEQMPKYHQIEILRILNSNLVYLNENNNGTFVNLSELEDKPIKLLENYARYVKEQQTHISKIEQEKDRLKILLKGKDST